MKSTVWRTVRAVREHTYLAVVSTGVITAALVLVGMFAMVTTNVRLVLGSWERDVHVSAYLRPGGSADAHTAVMQMLQSRPEVAAVKYVSEAEARAWMVERTPELAPVLDELGGDALPASLEITLRDGHTTPEALAAFVGSIREVGSFDDVDYGQEWVTRVDTFLSVLSALGVALGSFIGIAALFLVANTIHLVVYARRDELEIMRLVGATDRYILAPFVLEGAAQGAAAATLANALLWAAHRGLLSRLQEVLALALGGEGLRYLPWWGVGAMYAAGMVLGVGASWGAVRRFLGRLP
ncbi:MAG: permease-like cell division protein FtsX [Pseudomonadota bacterium]|nr:permease-like cell division protein FtsX [Pseudomonadota bacterium]